MEIANFVIVMFLPQCVKRMMFCGAKARDYISDQTLIPM